MTDVLYTDALIGNHALLEEGIGFEPLERACLMVMLGQLNDEIDVQSERWKPADLALQQVGAGSGVGQVDIPHIEPGNFHEGPHRSLIEAPIECFPNISMAAYATVPALTQFDQFDSSTTTLFIETMAIAGPVAEGTETMFETIVHRRIQRMTEAVSIVMLRNKTLLGTAHEMTTPPRGGIGNQSWLRPKNKGAGEKYIWHGSRLQYTLTRHHTTS